MQNTPLSTGRDINMFHGFQEMTNYVFKMRYIHSSIFTKCFILIRVAVDPEPTPGTLGAR